jgi:hypothetical protein
MDPNRKLISLRVRCENVVPLRRLEVISYICECKLFSFWPPIKIKLNERLIMVWSFYIALFLIE